jgi:hypothetical protein
MSPNITQTAMPGTLMPPVVAHGFLATHALKFLFANRGNLKLEIPISCAGRLK